MAVFSLGEKNPKLECSILECLARGLSLLLCTLSARVRWGLEKTC